MTPSRPASVTVALALVGGLLGSHGVAAGRASQQDVGDPACPPNALFAGTDRQQLEAEDLSSAVDSLSS